MNVQIDWGYVVSAAVIAVGIVQWMKGLLKRFPSWVWSAIIPAVSTGVAFAADGGVWQIATNALAVWAICQLGYELILQNIGKMIGGLLVSKNAAGIATDIPPAAK